MPHNHIDKIIMFCKSSCKKILYFTFTILTVIALFGGIYQDILKPVSTLFDINNKDDIKDKTKYKPIKAKITSKSDANFIGIAMCLSAFAEDISGLYQNCEIIDDVERCNVRIDGNFNNIVKISRSAYFKENNNILSDINKYVIIITPPLDDSLNTSQQKIIIKTSLTANATDVTYEENVIYINKEGYSITEIEKEFLYADLKKYLNTVGIKVLSSNDYLDDSGYISQKTCERRINGQVLISEDGGIRLGPL